MNDYEARQQAKHARPSERAANKPQEGTNPANGAKLPDLPSALIRVAIKDAAQLDQDRYSPDWRDWHVPILHAEDEGVCVICAAGAVIAGTLGAPIDKLREPCDFDEDTNSKLRALDCFRMGQVIHGVNLMGHPSTGLPGSNGEIPGGVYGALSRSAEFINWHGFKRSLDALGKLADYLEGIGL